MSGNPVERRVAEQFVDREPELKQFVQMLGNGDPPIFMVSGAGGLGKSWLVTRLAQESQRRGCHTITVQCSDTRTHTYEAIIRSVATFIGEERFKKLAAARSFIGEQRTPVSISLATPQISVAENARIDQSTVGLIAGAYFKDTTLIVPSTNTESLERDRQAQLTAAFFEDLASISSEKRVVIFFDAVEKMTTTSRAWVAGEMLSAVLDGRLNNVFVGIFGQVALELDPTVETAAIILRLNPLGVENIVDYLKRQGIDPKVTQPLAALLLTMTGGIPYNLAMQVAAHREALLAVAS